MAVIKDQLRLKLNTGALMPAVAFGTATMGKEVTAELIVEALEHGYRHLDTAAHYANEHIVGAGLQEAFKSGFVKREEVFVTAKLSTAELNPPDVLAALQKTLRLHTQKWPLISTNSLYDTI